MITIPKLRLPISYDVILNITQVNLLDNNLFRFCGIVKNKHLKQIYNKPINQISISNDSIRYLNA